MNVFYVCVGLFLISTFTFGFAVNPADSDGESLRADQCRIYDEIYCQHILNTSNPRFINSTLGYNNTETIAIQLGTQLDNLFLTSMRQHCKPLMKKVICHFVFPPCSPKGTRVEVCREDCHYLFSICGNELNQLVGAGKTILQGKASGLIFSFNDCDQNYKSENDYVGTNDSCQHLPFIDRPKLNDTTSSKTLIIILGVLCPVILLLLALFFCLRIRSRKSRAHSVHYETSKEDGLVNKDRLSNIVSMRDRIREWKVAPSELTELVEICKKRGLQDIPVDNIEYLKDLGAGQYGLVFQGKINQEIEGETTQIFAVKTLREGSSQDAVKEFCQEVNIMSTFCHPHVVKLIGVALADEPYCMIFEFVEFGDLASFLRNCADVVDDSNSSYPKLTVTDQLAMALQVASGMKYIASIRCVHRDLAARNCLVGRGLVVKISDFGLSRDVYASEYYRMEKTRMLPVRWLPPEAFVDGKFTVFSDIYSYGVLLWELFTFAKLPYEDYDNAKTMELILDGHLLEKPDICPDAVYDIMKKCWLSNPEERILFADIINEFCSLDDCGQRFQANEEELVKNFGRLLPEASSEAVSVDKQSNSLSYNNLSFSVDDAPINVERLPVQNKHLTEEQNLHYSTPRMKRNVFPKQDENSMKYDGVVVTSETAEHEHDRRRDADEAPDPPVPPRGLSKESHANRASPTSYENVHVTPQSQVNPHGPEEPQETYSVPPATLKRQLSKGSGLDVLLGEEPEETYDVPPVSQHSEPQETYDIPPHLSSDDDEAGETYDVPPVPHVPPISLDEPQETYEVPPRPRSQGDDEGPQDTYDVPPAHEEDSRELYSVPPSPYQQRRDDQPAASINRRKGQYENVDFDGKPRLMPKFV